MVVPNPNDTMVVMPPPFYKLFADWCGVHGVATVPAYDLPWKLPPGSPRVHVLKLVQPTAPRAPVGWTNHLAFELRKVLGCGSREKFAGLLGVTRNAVNKWEVASERGLTSNLNPSTRAALSRVLAFAPSDVQDHFARYGLHQDASLGE